MALTNKLTAIADEIRLYTGETEALTLEEMAASISNVYDAGLEVGYGNAEAEFWNGFINGRSDWNYVFYGWGNERIKPPTKIAIPSTNQTFYKCVNLKIIEKDCFDFSSATPSETASSSGNYRTFYGCQSIEVIEDIGMPSGYYNRTYDGCWKLHTLDVLRSTKDTGYNNPFNGCTSLVRIGAILDNDGNPGVIGQNGFDVSKCDLERETLLRIFISLYDYLGTGEGGSHTITIGTKNQEKVREEIETIAKPKGWTVA